MKPSDRRDWTTFNAHTDSASNAVGTKPSLWVFAGGIRMASSRVPHPFAPLCERVGDYDCERHRHFGEHRNQNKSLGLLFVYFT
jgi:hypothetical protein